MSRLEDLRGKTVAFVDPASPSGYICVSGIAGLADEQARAALHQRARARGAAEADLRHVGKRFPRPEMDVWVTAAERALLELTVARLRRRAMALTLDEPGCIVAE